MKRAWRRGLAVLGVLLLAGAAFLWTPDLDRGTLEARYLASPADYRELAGLRLHVRVSGPAAAPAIVLLHGFGASLQTWDAWAASLASTHRVIRFDLPGFGLTGADPTNDYSDERAIVIIDALLDSLGIARAHLVGNSLGGRIAWRYALARPERVERLVLISPDGFASPGFDYDTAPEVPAVMQLMRWVMPRFLVRMNLLPAYADPAALSDALLTRYWELLRAPGVRAALLARLAGLRLPRPEPLLAQLRQPTLLLWGEQDRLIPVSHAEDYLRVMKDASLIRLPALGHVPQEEAPALSLPPVQAFLALGAHDHAHDHAPH